MSFSLTVDQVRDRSKTVSRRLGWLFLKPGDLVWACEKCQGLKKGEKVKRLDLVRIVSTKREPLDAITPPDCVREGFPDLDPADFVIMFCRHMKATPTTIVTRIEFEYVDNVPI